MKLYVAIPVVLLAFLIAASGIAAITRGWVLPTNRRTVHHPRLYGWGQLLAACALCSQQVFFWVPNAPGTRQWGSLSGSALLLTGLIVMMLSYRTGGNRQGSGTP
ncbi:hypothetical protein FHX80_112926 [Streptomyces brevispora]|uniref:Uncharacterized protein n=1 Tax=Streptomyces brevispora TaxID=887462 RepID=A0A561UYQ9_9ACTN|nr:hypothetical protein [Streptomyces brevispora]TWG04474.1 hypothetical protein FHX80_112926 [Streptomyces brevispora]